MGKYYLHSGTVQEGPFSIDELKAKQITADTMVWYNGLPEWTKAGQIPELKDILTITPPPFASKTPPPINATGNTQAVKADGLWKIVKNGALLILIFLGGVWIVSLFIRSGVGSTPFKVVVNPPKPRLVESHGAEDPSSSITGFHEGVYATILNEGGSGKVMIKATLKQDVNVYVQTDFANIGENQTKEFHFDFTEPSRFGGRMVYDITATAME